MIPLEILLALCFIAILVAIIYTIFDHRDLRRKYEEYVETVTAELAGIRTEIKTLKQRAGV